MTGRPPLRPVTGRPPYRPTTGRPPYRPPQTGRPPLRNPTTTTKKPIPGNERIRFLNGWIAQELIQVVYVCIGQSRVQLKDQTVPAWFIRPEK